MILNPLMKICMKMMRKKNTEGNWDRFKNIAFFTEYGDKVKLVEDVDLLDDEDLESGITYVDGNYARDEYDYWDASSRRKYTCRNT